MTKLLISLIAMLAACKPSERTIRALVDEPGSYSCTCYDGGAPVQGDAAVDASPDAAIDATPDAPPDAPPVLDLTAPWTRTVITAGASTGIYRGADGIAEAGPDCYVTGWEEGGITTRACLVAGAWVTEVVATGLLGPEDAKAADLDGDGEIDMVSAADAGERIYVTFRGSTNVTIDLTASHGHGHVMQVAIADVNNDGNPDIVYGTRIGAAELGWLEHPGNAIARTPGAWARHRIADAGWAMSVIPRDVDGDGDLDLVTSDRTHLDATAAAAAGISIYANYGVHWWEQTVTGWLNHAISYPSGSCSPWGSTTCLKTPGDEMFATVGDDGLTVYACESAASKEDSRVTIHRTVTGADHWLTWTHEVLPPVPLVGHCQGVWPRDVDHDGLMDLVVSTWKGGTSPIDPAHAGNSGTYWLHRTATGYERGEISGALGGKFDSIVFRGDSVLATEQLDPAGGLGVVMYTPPWVP